MNDQDNIYYNCLITNLNNEYGTPQPIDFTDTRSISLVDNTTNYKMSIIRFTLDTQNLPIFIPSIQQNQSNPNLTTYSLTFSYNNFNFQQYLIFKPQNSYINQPNTVPSNFIDPSNPYYYVYTYQYFTELINDTFKNCLEGLNNLVGNEITDKEPTMIYNTNSSLFQINLDLNNYGYNESNKINIYFNTNLFSLLSSFPSEFKGYNLTEGMNYQIRATSNDIVQETSTISTLNPIQSIVFTSSLLPVIPTSLSSQSISNGITISSNNPNNDTSNIITDFVSSDMLYNPFLVYEPTVFRYIDLIPNKRIDNVNLKIYWLSKTGVFVPFILPTEGTCTVKILFTKTK